MARYPDLIESASVTIKLKDGTSYTIHLDDLDPFGTGVDLSTDPTEFEAFHTNPSPYDGFLRGIRWDVSVRLKGRAYQWEGEPRPGEPHVPMRMVEA